MQRIMTIARSRFAPSDILALAILVALLIVAFFTFDDYGLGWDDYTHSQYGEMLFSYYASGFKDLRAFSFVNLFYYGGGFDLAAHTLGKILPFDIFDIRRLLGALIGIAGLAIVWRTGRRMGGPIAGVAAIALLATTPLYYGHMYINAKDAPFAVAMVFLLFTLVRAFDEYPRPRPSTILLFGLALGLTIGTRVIGGIAVAFAGIGAAFLLAGEIYATNWRASITRMAIFVGKMALALPLAYVVMGIIWPWSVLAPLNPIRAIEYYSHFWENPWKEMYDGIAILIPNMPRSYVPKLCLLKFPEIFLGLAIAGTAGAVVASVAGEVEIEATRVADAPGLGRRAADRAHRHHQARDVQWHPSFRVRDAAIRDPRRVSCGLHLSAARILPPSLRDGRRQRFRASHRVDDRGSRPHPPLSVRAFQPYRRR